MYHQIFWGEKTAATFLYGSTIQFLKNKRVIFKNLYMAPSLVIKEWQSQQNFQGTRQVTTLPNLKTGQTYRINVIADVIPLNTMHIKMSFYDYSNECIDFIISTTHTFEVLIPNNTYAYTMQLINAGCYTIDFTKIEVSSIEQELQKVKFNEWLNINANKKEVTILFVESPDEHMVFDSYKLENILLILCQDKEQAKKLLSSEHHVWLKSKILEINKLCHKVEKINFVGYGAFSNLLVLAHSSFFDNSCCHITDLLFSIEMYEQIFKNNLTIFKDIPSILSRMNNSQVNVLNLAENKEELVFLQSLLSLESVLIEMNLINHF